MITIIILKFYIHFAIYRSYFICISVFAQETLDKGWVDGWMDSWVDGYLMSGRKEGNKVSPYIVHPEIGGMNWERSYYSFNLIFSVIQI